MYNRGQRLDHDHVNALKHVYFSYFNSLYLGEQLARDLGNAHEYGQSLSTVNRNPVSDFEKAVLMDLLNNEIGYTFLNRQLPAFYIRPEDVIWSRAIAGDFYVWHDRGQELPTVGKRPIR